MGEVIEGGAHADQFFNTKRGANRRGGVHVSQFSTKRAPYRWGVHVGKLFY